MIREEVYIELVNNSLAQLDKCQRNVDDIITALSGVMTKETSKKEYSEEEKLKAAYALNLCTVSVSQIVDYNDIHILEQEYEMILNNLNLENMPKDEALLNILKQLLDTITFFRVQEGDKKLIDKEYQHKMSNAIWSAVPNFGLIVAGGNPLTMAVSLASQVGIGYMNYRRTKAENKLEQERTYWQLQRAAIEQLNGLRRELFDTAWRLADEYNFPDAYRLTEKQIKQYNNILMDTDSIRKYERLCSIQDKFQAYVPFWYHFGNTANQIAQNVNYSLQIRNKYRQLAKEHFETFQSLNDKELLREDQIASACALEYIDLLDVDQDANLIKKLISEAVQSSGGSSDVLELCAIAYLKVLDTDKASDLLRRLVNEDYNAILNAQILSNIYVSNFVYKKNPDMALTNYEILETRVEKEYLFPLPLDGVYDINKLNADFNVSQQKMLRVKFHMAINEFIRKYTVKYNRLFPVADHTKEYADTYFRDGELERGKRFEDIEMVLKNPRKKQVFCERLKDESIIYNMFEVINEMYESVSSLDMIYDCEFLELQLTGGIIKCKDLINKVTEALSNGKYDEITVGDLSSVSFKDIIYDFCKEFNDQLMEYICSCDSMEKIAIANSNLRSFCMSQQLPDPDKLYEKKVGYRHVIVPKRIFSPKLLGLDYAEFAKENELKRRCLDIVKEYQERICFDEKVSFLLEGTTEFESYFRIIKGDEVLAWKKNTIAIIDDKTSSDMDILITTKGIVAIKHNNIFSMALYDGINLSDNALLGDGYKEALMRDIVLGAACPTAFWIKKAYDKLSKNMCEFRYKNKNIDIKVLYDLIMELDNEIPKSNSLGKLLDINFEVNKGEIGGKDYYPFLYVD